jgi:hypothetical protein
MLCRPPVASAGLLLFISGVSFALAQGTPGPTPGPTNPIPPNPRTKTGETMAIRTTEDECRKGWDQNLWRTKYQFEHFCTQLKASK